MFTCWSGTTYRFPQVHGRIHAAHGRCGRGQRATSAPMPIYVLFCRARCTPEKCRIQGETPKIPYKARGANFSGPKSAGANAMPQGEWRGPLDAKCFTKLPSVSKMSTKPPCALFRAVYVTQMWPLMV